VSNPESILRKGKTIQGQTSRADPKGNPLFSSGKSSAEKVEFFSENTDDKKSCKYCRRTNSF
jgi:hypothetical protein